MTDKDLDRRPASGPTPTPTLKPCTRCGAKNYGNHKRGKCPRCRAETSNVYEVVERAGGFAGSSPTAGAPEEATQLEATVAGSEKQADAAVELGMRIAGLWQAVYEDEEERTTILRRVRAALERPERASSLISERSERLRGPSPQVLAVEALTAARLSAEQERDALRADARTVAEFVVGYWPGLEDAIPGGSSAINDFPAHRAAERILARRTTPESRE